MGNKSQPKPTRDPSEGSPDKRSPPASRPKDVELSEGKAAGVKPIMFHQETPGMPDVPDAPSQSAPGVDGAGDPASGDGGQSAPESVNDPGGDSASEE